MRDDRRLISCLAEMTTTTTFFFPIVATLGAFIESKLFLIIVLSCLIEDQQLLGQIVGLLTEGHGRGSPNSG